MLKRLRSQKGFTLVEIIVVVAIIAVMSTVMVISMSPHEERREAARQYAETFFYNTQSVMSEMRSNDIALPDEVKNDSLFLFYAGTSYDKADRKLSVNTGLVDISDSNTLVLLKTYTFPPSDANYSTSIPYSDSIVKSLNGFEQDGTFLALVDKNYRVKKAYFSQASISTLATANYTFDSDGYISDTLTGAYPWTEANSGKKMTE